MNIFKIQQDLLDVFAELEENGGELTEELEQKLNVTQENFKTKVKGYSDVIKVNKSEIDLIDKEIARLKTLKESKEKAIERLSKVIAQAITLFGDETKSGGKYFDYGTGKISVRNTQKVEVDTERADSVVKNMFGYFTTLAYTKEYFQNSEIKKEDAIHYIRTIEGGMDIDAVDIDNIPATLSFDVNLKEILSGKGLAFMQQFFEFVNNYKVKSNVSKTAIKDEILNGEIDVSKIAHIVENQSITIK